MMEHSYNNTKDPSAWYNMEIRPKHLPLHKQQALQDIVLAILSRHDVEMIILFGSHARGDWVEDVYEEDHITYEYRSDFDILIVTADKNTEHKVAYDDTLKEALEPAYNGTSVNYIPHTIHHVNQMLAERRFFFMDILKEGYMLFDSGHYKLARPPKQLPPEVMLKHAEEYFEEWKGSADGFFEMYEAALNSQRYKIAAFQLHQSSERYLTSLLLVHTGYRAKEHDMEKLLRQAEGFDQRYAEIFPCNTDEEKHLFGLLSRAYVDARYSKGYTVCEKELKVIAERIEQLRAVTEDACEQRLKTLRKAMEATRNLGKLTPIHTWMGETIKIDGASV